jgi:hypothetical protein
VLPSNLFNLKWGMVHLFFFGWTGGIRVEFWWKSTVVFVSNNILLFLKNKSYFIQHFQIFSNFFKFYHTKSNIVIHAVNLNNIRI